MHWTSCQTGASFNGGCCFGKWKYPLFPHRHRLSWLTILAHLWVKRQHMHLRGGLCPLSLAVMHGWRPCTLLPSDYLDKDMCPVSNAWSPCSLYLSLWQYGLVVSHLEQCMSVMWKQHACVPLGVDSFHLTFFDYQLWLSFFYGTKRGNWSFQVSKEYDTLRVFYKGIFTAGQ